MRINIAIDGPSAAGKSTIAKKCAKLLGYSHLDTGAMYRCVAYKAKKEGIDWNDEEKLAEMIKNMKIDFDKNGNVYLDHEDVSQKIRTNDISMGASSVSRHLKVRECLVELQQQIAKNKGYILDGRDIGTVVLKDAELKIYLVASASARAERRIKEYIEKGIDFDRDEIIKDIERRDYQDMHREHSPLKKAEDAIEIDSSDLTIDEVVSKIKNELDRLGVVYD
ncbi:(d)CMP kinase [Traorella massiliensis]|uniref:(d)CMP kinase n=1 Tax=Traorella massiliensis TaxID=1903263 RepID=UPI0008F83A0E|nr:(d)CMP kinase [Traorella massiliensis]